jgi:hypothetical protein
MNSSSLVPASVYRVLRDAPVGLLVVESGQQPFPRQPRFTLLPLASVLFLGPHLAQQVAQRFPEIFPHDGLEAARGEEWQERGELVGEVGRVGRVQGEVGLEEGEDEGCG